MKSRVCALTLVIGLLGSCQAIFQNIHGEEGMNVYDEFVKIFNEHAITVESVRHIREKLFERFSVCLNKPSLCAKCLTVDSLLQIAANQSRPEVGLDEYQFRRVAVVMFFTAVNIEQVCEDPPDNYLTYRLGVGNMYKDNDGSAPGHLTIKQLKNILQAINSTYVPQKNNQCFGEQNIFEQLHIPKASAALGEDIERVAAMVLLNLVQGNCISHTIDSYYFLHWIFTKYGQNGTMSKQSFSKLMQDVRLGEASDFGHNEHLHDHENHEEHNDEHDEHDNHDDDHVDDHDDDHGGEHDDERHGNHDHKRRKRSKTSSPTTIHGDDEEHINADLCFSTEGLWKVFDYSHLSSITESQFVEVCPAVIQQLISEACTDHDKHGSHNDGDTSEDTPTTAEVYGYGSLAIFIISLMALIGALTIPFMSSVSYTYVMMGFIALAVGTMAGDALLHLIPKALGLHGHGGEDSHQDHATTYRGASEAEAVHGIEFDPTVLKMLGVIAALYGFFVFEILMELAKDSFSRKTKGEFDLTSQDTNGHGHSHIPDQQAVKKCIKKPLPASISTQQLTTNMDMSRVASISSIANTSLDNNMNFDNVSTSPKLSQTSGVKFFTGFKPVVLILLIGDIMHNVSDGLAIGAAFAGDLQGGISTSIAVFCHELPHELGDFAIFLTLGLSVKQALSLNLFSACTAFAGFYVGASVGADTVVRQWIFAATAGMFLYISLVEMLPELKSYKAKSLTKTFIVQNVGLLVGLGAMFVIAVFEEHIKV